MEIQNITGNPPQQEVGDAAGDTARDAAGDTVGDAAGDAAGDAVGDTAGDTVGDTAGDAVGDAAGDTVGDLSHAVDIGWLDPDKASFYEGTGGFVGLRYGGKEYKRIQLRRAMPDRNPSEFISVADRESKEIGIIHALSDLSGDQLRIVADELNRRYYCPEIVAVKSVRDKLGYVYMEMEVFAGGERHERSAAINDVNKNIRMLGLNRLIIFDVDGNRFIINELDKLDKKSLRRLEPYIF